MGKFNESTLNASPPAASEQAATWHGLDGNGLAELRVNGRRITSFPSYGAAREAADRINAALSERPAAEGWRPIETAPKDGTHILACIGPYREHWTFAQQPPAVIHYWDNEGEEGFYLSAGGSPDEEPYPATDWMPLPAPPALPQDVETKEGGAS